METTPVIPVDPAPVVIPVTVPAVVAPVRPGDLILVRAIAWWSSGQLQRVVFGILGTAAPICYDLIDKNALTWRSGLNALMLGTFAWLGYSRAKSPDVVTGVNALDKTGTASRVDAQTLSNIQKAAALTVGKGA